MGKKLIDTPNDFDELQMKLGGLSWYQINCFTFVLIAVVGPGFYGQLAVFLSAIPEYRCDFHPNNTDFLSNYTEKEILDLTVPFSDVKQNYERCYQYKIDHEANCTGVDCIDYNQQVSICEHGYHYSEEHFDETAVSEYNLICDRQYLDTIVNTIFCVGYFFGSIVSGPMSDWFGRKRALTFHCFTFTCLGFGMSFSPNFTVFMVLRFLSACSGIAAYLTAFTYVTEICPQKYRNTMILICSLSQSLSHVLVPVIGYFFRRWRMVSLIGSLLPLPLVILYPFIPESPRWLLSTGRIEEAKKVAHKFAKSHGTKLSDDDWNHVVKIETEGSKTQKKNYTLIDLFSKKRTRFVSIIIAQAWFTCSFLFYGMTLNIGNFFGNPYLNAFINSGIEILGNFMILLAPCFGKTKLLSLTLLLSGLACIASTLCSLFVKESMSAVVLAVFGKMNSQAVQLLVYAITAEIYPTLARGTGMSLGSMSARVGSSISPLTIQLQSTIPWATQTIFGVCGIISAALSMFLPNTQNASFFRTLGDAEEFYRRKLHLYNRITGYKRDSISSHKLGLDENGNPEETEKLKTEV